MENRVTGLDELLAGFAAGTLAVPTQAMIGAHLELSNKHRDYVSSLETLAAVGLDEAEPVSMSNRDSVLADILKSDIALEETTSSAEPAKQVEHVSRIPASLHSIVGTSFDDLKWKTLLPGVKECDFGEIDGCETSLLWVKNGKAMPTHTHEGIELTLVLQGGFKDSLGHFTRGDLAFANDEIDHKPIADEGEDCICYVVTEGRLRLTGPIGRLFDGFLR